MRHGVGRSQSSPGLAARFGAEARVALVYCDARGEVGDDVNPNGSIANIAGIYGGPRKNVLGLMPHPENHVIARQFPGFTSGARGEIGLALFEQGVRYAKER